MADHPLDVLERRLEEAARRQLATPPRRSRRFLFLAAVLATFTAGGAAFAVTSLLPTGSPVAYRLGKPAPGKGYGTPVDGSVRMLTDSVKDPVGGLPWGLRSFATTRGYTCLQVGRVQDGKLGFVGRDRMFHELRPGVVTNPTQCVADDGAGHGFLALHYTALPAGADPLNCSTTPLTARSGLSACRTAELRSVDLGLLGASATALTARGGAKVDLLGPDRGYLLVGKGRAPQVKTVHGGAIMIVDDSRAALTPSSPKLTRVDYGARTCRVTTTTDPRGSCGDPPGFVPIPKPGNVDVRASVHARFIGAHALRIRFRAPVAVTGANAAYNVLVRLPHCDTSTAVGTDVEHNVAVGETVVKDIAVGSGCNGRYRVVVSYRSRRPYPRPGSSGLRYPGKIVDRVTVTKP
ncbi:hypothetical protein OM076_22155 [Solirubrobacter ginsenosidimutans]|uniref:Uncharacterized protein n=1 Tax=Solirubrobacter ginsenosidimutans TaxID=490573 RepID=A0A9X3S327_9ACTN|nr:hypothetical protein [Solirubrobacter ginsenosidimutans]MDA0162992.1 hypothetical protein [Solirubrobacter ginsenosidimutans]